MFLSSPFLNTLSLCSSHNVTHQVSHPYKKNRQNYSCVHFNIYIFGWWTEEKGFCT
jgi:hypothetical protein